MKNRHWHCSFVSFFHLYFIYLLMQHIIIVFVIVSDHSIAPCRWSVAKKARLIHTVELVCKVASSARISRRSIICKVSDLRAIFVK